MDTRVFARALLVFARATMSDCDAWRATLQHLGAFAHALAATLALPRETCVLARRLFGGRAYFSSGFSAPIDGAAWLEAFATGAGDEALLITRAARDIDDALEAVTRDERQCRVDNDDVFVPNFDAFSSSSSSSPSSSSSSSLSSSSSSSSFFSSSFSSLAGASSALTSSSSAATGSSSAYFSPASSSSSSSSAFYAPMPPSIKREDAILRKPSQTFIDLTTDDDANDNDHAEHTVVNDANNTTTTTTNDDRVDAPQIIVSSSNKRRRDEIPSNRSLTRTRLRASLRHVTANDDDDSSASSASSSTSSSSSSSSSSASSSASSSTASMSVIVEPTLSSNVATAFLAQAVADRSLERQRAFAFGTLVDATSSFVAELVREPHGILAAFLVESRRRRALPHFEHVNHNSSSSSSSSSSFASSSSSASMTATRVGETFDAWRLAFVECGHRERDDPSDRTLSSSSTATSVEDSLRRAWSTRLALGLAARHCARAFASEATDARIGEMASLDRRRVRAARRALERIIDRAPLALDLLVMGRIDAPESLADAMTFCTDRARAPAWRTLVATWSRRGVDRRVARSDGQYAAWAWLALSA